MTVPAQTPVSTHVGNGVTTSFAYGFKLLDQADIQVSVAGVVKTLTTDYTVTGVGVDAGGTIVFVSAPANLAAIALARNVTVQRLTDYQYSGDFQSPTVNRDFDRIVMMLQDSGVNVANAIRFPIGDAADGVLPGAAARASKALAFDASGNLVLAAGAGDATTLAVMLLSYASALLGGGLVGYDGSLNYAANTIGKGVKDAAATASTALATADSATTNINTYKTDVASITDAAKGAALMGYKAPGTGSVGRTLYAKLSEATISVKDFGAVGDGVADDTAEINAAIAAHPGKRILFPQGTYKISSSILLTGDGTRLQGDALWGVQISCTTLNTPIINISSPFCSVDALSVVYAGGTPVSGANAIHVNSNGVSMTNIVVRNGYVGINVTSAGVALAVRDFDVLDYESAGVLLTDVNDVFMSDFIMNPGNLTRGALGGFRLFGNVQALVVQNGDVIGGAYGMTTDATTNTYNQRPSYNKFTNVYFDSTNNGVSLNKTVSTTFESCWFASSKAYSGLEITTSDCIVFQKCEIVNNWQHGAIINASSSRIIFEACKVLANSQQTSATYHGLNFAAGASDFRVQGNIVGNHIGFNARQQFGILVNTGASDRYVVADNLVNNNLSSGVSDGGTGVNKRVANNY